MEFNLKLQEKYLIKPNIPFFFEERSGGDNANPRFVRDSIGDNPSIIVINRIEKVNDTFYKVYFVFSNDASRGYYSQHSNPFFLLYDDSTLIFPEFFIENVLRGESNYLYKISAFLEKICMVEDEFEEELLRKRQHLDGLKFTNRLQQNKHENEINLYLTTHFNERTDFKKYDKKVQDVLNNGTDGSEVKS